MIKNFARLAALSLTLSSGGVAAQLAKPSTTVPTELQGNWHETWHNVSPVCSDDDLGLLQIDATGFTYPLEFGTVTRVTEVEDNSYRVDFMETALTDDPRNTSRPKPATHHWTLSYDAQHLTVNTGSAVYDLSRCTAQPSQ